MNSVTLLALLIFTCTSRGGRTGYSDFKELVGEDFEKEFFDDELAYSSSFEDSVEDLMTVEFFQTDRPHTQSLREEYQEAEEENSTNDTSTEEVFKHPLEDPTALHTALNEVNVDKRYNHFLVHPFDDHNAKTPLQNQEPESYQTPKRREVKEWRVSDDLFDLPANNPSWVVDAYLPKTGKSEYIEVSSYAEDKSQEVPTVIVAGDYKDHNTQAKHPQYFQKNYYYNYYPLINDRKRWNSEEIYFSEDSKKRPNTVMSRKNPTTNPCKQYLEFLKYAFERLDENSEYYYEPNEEYSEEYRNRDSEKPHSVSHLLGTHLLGPTFYIDNSGKISQVNTNGNSIQVADGISPEPKVSNFSKSVAETKSVTQETVTSTIEPSTTITVSHSSKTENPPKSTKSETLMSTPQTTQWKTEKQPPTSTVAPAVVEITTTEENKLESTTIQEEFTSRMGGPTEEIPFVENQTTTTVKSQPQLDQLTIIPATTSKTLHNENQVNVKTVLRIENSTAEKQDDVDCKDKMLPCPDTVNITYPLNGYCNRYVSCESGRAIRRTCPEGLHFNLIIKSCDLPHNSFCTYVCPQPNGNFGIPGDCGGYFVCKNSNAEYRMCPPRMHWDINKGICTFSQLSSCPMKCFRDNEVRHYEGDCKAYIVCLNGIPYYHKCPPNTKFDKTNLVCVPDHLSKCVDDPKLLTNTLNPNTLCKDVELQLNTKSWCRSFLPFDKQKF